MREEEARPGPELPDFLRPKAVMFQPQPEWTPGLSLTETEFINLARQTRNAAAQKTGRELTPFQTDWLESLATNLYRLNTLISRGDDHWSAARIGFTYGLAEVLFHHNRRRIAVVFKPTILAKFRDTAEARYFPTALAAGRVSGLLLPGNQDGGPTNDRLLEDLHQARLLVLERQLPDDWGVQNPDQLLALPIYVVARQMASQSTPEASRQQVREDFGEELNLVAYYSTWAGRAATEPWLGPNSSHLSWEGAETVIKDCLLLQSAWPAFGLVNHILAGVTGIHGHDNRLWAGRSLRLAHFGLEPQGPIVQEAAPKSVWGILDKIMRQPKIDRLLHQVTTNLGISQPNPNLDRNLPDNYRLHVAVWEKIRALSEIIYRYYQDPAVAQGFLIRQLQNELVETIPRLPDIFRLRVFTPAGGLDRLGRQAQQLGLDTTVYFERRPPNGQREVKLNEGSSVSGSVEEEILSYYRRRPDQDPLAALVITAPVKSTSLCPLAIPAGIICQAQVIPESAARQAGRFRSVDQPDSLFLEASLLDPLEAELQAIMSRESWQRREKALTRSRTS